MSIQKAISPSVALLAKLGSILVHMEEGRSSEGHHFDWAAIDALMTDPEVRCWLLAMDRGGFLPKKRGNP